MSNSDNNENNDNFMQFYAEFVKNNENIKKLEEENEKLQREIEEKKAKNEILTKEQIAKIEKVLKQAEEFSNKIAPLTDLLQKIEKDNLKNK